MEVASLIFCPSEPCGGHDRIKGFQYGRTPFYRLASNEQRTPQPKGFEGVAAVQVKRLGTVLPLLKRVPDLSAHCGRRPRFDYRQEPRGGGYQQRNVPTDGIDVAFARYEPGSFARAHGRPSSGFSFGGGWRPGDSAAHSPLA